MDFDYDELLKKFSESDEVDLDKDDDFAVRTFDEIQKERQKKVNDFKVSIDSESSEAKPAQNKGVYFSNPPKNIGREAQKVKRAPARRDTTQKKLQVSAPPATDKQKKFIALKEAKAKKRANSFLGKYFTSEKASGLILSVAIIIFASVILCVYGIGCINDVLALDVEEKTVEVTVSENMTDGEVISILEDKELIKNELFCKLFVKLLDITSGSDEKEAYVSGVYTLNSKDGLEKMLATMKADITLSEIVTLTFPEGWTIDQIAEKLEANEVCSAASFVNTLKSVDFSEEYDFIKAIPNKEKRFHVLEGYMYPDTYEFYKGENASSVVRRFLDNFENRWTDEYQKLADKRGVSLDEIIILASVLQKEAATSDQMDEISSILYNRLERPAAFPWLQCDSTEDYLLKTIKPTLTSSTEDVQKYIEYRDNYDTYSTECTGLPIGAIANPGDAAIKAALKPADTGYLYFRHDKNGKVYYASSLSEHEANGRIVAEVDGE